MKTRGSGGPQKKEKGAGGVDAVEVARAPQRATARHSNASMPNSAKASKTKPSPPEKVCRNTKRQSPSAQNTQKAPSAAQATSMRATRLSSLTSKLKTPKVAAPPVAKRLNKVESKIASVSKIIKKAGKKEEPAVQSVASLSPMVGVENEGSRKDSVTHDEEIDSGDTSSPPPVKEIHTTLQQMTDPAFSSDKKRSSEGRGPKYLDERTLALFKNYLDSGDNGDILDDDDVAGFSIRMDRIANQQARYQMALVSGRPAAKAADASDISEAGSDDTSIFEECLAEEEEHAIGHDLFKKVVFNIAHQQSSDGKSALAGSSGSKTSIITGSKTLDKKTLTWIKRATGLHRSEAGTVLVKSKNSDAKGGRMSTRRYTRTQARDSRQKKRERGLDILGLAISQLEEEYGPFPVRVVPKAVRVKKKCRPAKEMQLDDEIEIEDGRKRQKDSEIEGYRRKKKGSKQTKENEGPTKRKAKDIAHTSRRSPSEPRGNKKRKISSKEQNEEPPKKICTSLRVLDWLWRDFTKQFHDSEDQLETEADYRTRKSIPLHPQFVEAGIVHRLPHMHTLARARDNANQTPSRVYDPPRRRHSDRQYGELCSRLMNCLKGQVGQARLFATCEFFYSDLDREWYNHNAFAVGAANLGILSDALLTRSEWKAIRRRMRKRPRRFSRQFIISQLNKRNEYRCTIRMLQNNPHLSVAADFPLHVYLPIRVGTTVTAFSKRFRIIQRGKVLTYDRNMALYLIEFENKQFGFELCPDSDVATCGMPEILIRCANDRLVGQTTCVMPNQPTPGSSTGPLQEMQPLPPFTPDGEITRFLEFCPIRYMGRGKAAKPSKNSAENDMGVCTTPLLERVANHEAFVSLLETIDIARNRKRDLLSLIEDANGLMVANLPFGYVDAPSSCLSRPTEEHISWLLTNLERTNQVLYVAMEYLRILYGEAYRPSIVNEPNDGADARGHKLSFLERVLDGALASRDSSRSTLVNDWTVNVVANAEDVGKTMAASLAKAISPAAVQVGDCSIDLNDRLSAACQLVFTASYVMHVADGPLGIESYSALAAAGEKLTSDVFPRADRSHNLYNEVLDARGIAVNDVNEALSLLKAELELSNLKQSVARG